MPDSLRVICGQGAHPGCEEEAFVHYALHRLYLQREEGVQAQTEKERVLQVYPNTRYAALLRGEAEEAPKGIATTREFRAMVDHVESRRWASAMGVYASTTWNADEAPRAALLNAQATGGKSGRVAFIAALTEVEEGFPNTPQAVAAGNIKMSLASEADETAGVSSPYTEALAVPHQVLIIFSSSGNSNDVRNALARFHQQYFAGSPMSIRLLPLDESSQIVAVDGFKNSSEAMDYRTKVRRASAVTQFLNPYDPVYWPITVQNFAHFYTNKDLTGYKRFVEMMYTL